MAYVNALNMWEVARPHMEKLVAQTNESTSMAQLDGSDIVYVARVAVPKIVTLAVTIGTRFPAPATSMGKVLLAALPPAAVGGVLAEPSRSGITPRWRPSPTDLEAALREVRAKGWALADQDLAPGIRSVAAGVRDGDGRVIAAVNVTVHAAETSVDTLLEDHLPKLLRTAADISHDWSLTAAVPAVSV
jgi:IclR family pca regulon transcriptional regulator